MPGLRLLIDTEEFFDSTVAPGVELVETAPTSQEDNDGYKTLAVLTMAILLCVALMIGQVLERNEIDWMSEAGAALIIGIVVGLVLNISTIAVQYEDVFRFNTGFFFIALLPPIIFDAGFNLDVKPFFNNIGAICTFAFAGTAVSTGVIAITMWLLGAIGAVYKLSFFEASVFGAIISATDPVTVLAVFGRLHADKDLNALVLGEAVINDAVAIVLYKVIMNFQDSPVTMAGLFLGIWQFTYIFLGSLAIGAGFGLIAAFLFKTQYFRNDHTPLETALVILIAYCSFYMADGMGQSGIVSIMFCGVVMARYVRPNLSDVTSDRVGAFFRVIATLAETFVFIYIGMSLFTEQQAWDSGLAWSFMLFCLFALAASRAANIYPLSALINMARVEEKQITPKFKFMLWFSGLRGAMAFALAMLGREKLGPAGDVIFTATFFMILMTVMINGGASPFMIEKLNLRDLPSSPPPRGLLGEFRDSVYLEEDSGDNPPLRGLYLPPLDVDTDINMSTPVPQSTRAASAPGNSSALMERIYDFQRNGVVTESMKLVDETLNRVLLTPDSHSSVSVHSSIGSQHSSSHTMDDSDGAGPCLSTRTRSRSPMTSLAGGIAAFELGN